MPVIVTERPYRPVPTDPPRKRWTRQECEAMAKTGLWDQEKLELIEGALINQMGKNRSHTIALTALRNLLILIFGGQFVDQETSIDVAPEDNPTNEPEPDLIVLAKPSSKFERNPRPGDLRLLVEVSDTTVGFDLTTKAALYARAGIPDYWVLDIPARRMIVHREPREGLYRSVTAYSQQESVTPLAAPDQAVRITDIFAGD